MAEELVRFHNYSITVEQGKKIILKKNLYQNRHDYIQLALFFFIGDIDANLKEGRAAHVPFIVSIDH